MSVVATIDATDADSLVAVSGWTHHAYLLVGALDVVVHDDTVTIEFEQEPLDPVLDLPQRELVRRSWWATDYRLPYVRCRLHVRSAHRTIAPDRVLLVDTTLLGVRWHGDKRRVEITTGWGPIAVEAEALNVRLEITDEVVSVPRQGIRRLWRVDAGAVSSRSGSARNRSIGRAPARVSCGRTRL